MSATVDFKVSSEKSKRFVSLWETFEIGVGPKGAKGRGYEAKS